MKKIFIISILMIISLLTKAQNDTQLPQYFIEGGDTIGIIMSVEQAQMLDNDAELLEIFKKMKLDCDNLDLHYVEVINNLEQKVALLVVQKEDLVRQGIEKNLLIENLNEQLLNCQTECTLRIQQVDIKDQEISILKKEITKQKIKKGFSIAGNAILAVVSLILIVKS